MHNPFWCKYFGIKIENVKKYNTRLLKRFDIINKFSEHELNLISIYIGTKPMQNFNLADIQTYLTTGQITYDRIDNTSKIIKKTAKQIYSIVKKTLSAKEERYNLFINELSALITRHQKTIMYNLYRCMDIGYDSNTINTFSSWSMIPLPGFCETGGIVHLYKLTGGCKGLYIEINEISETWPDFYNYEVILAPGVEFVEYKTETINKISYAYIYGKKYDDETDADVIIIHYIKLR